MIETVGQLGELRARVERWKRDGLRIGLVPTMGNLHAGHYSLVELARRHADRVVASVFVNPTQFGPGEDFDRYPRTPCEDAAGLESAGCDLLWLPPVEAMYPFGPGNAVVSRLFNQVQPDVAAFGRKDYQQLAVVRYMVRDLAFPIELLAGETVREADGLAMSSRNRYLSPAERAVAPEIHRTLQAMREGVVAGRRRGEVEAAARERLASGGFDVDYAVIRTTALAEPAPGHRGALVALAAARLGNTRLIDNLEFRTHGDDA